MLGLIVHTEQSDYGISHIVFISREEPLFYIQKENMEHIYWLPKKKRWLIEKELKEKELDIGDWIKFSRENVRGQFIEDYRKEFPMCPVRCFKDIFQVKTTCIFSPKLGTTEECICESELFGKVEVDANVAMRFIPNVVFDAWISIRVSQDGLSLNVSFGEYVDVCECQEMARCVSWNRNDKRFNLTVISVDPCNHTGSSIGESILGPNDVVEIYDGVGIVTGDRELFAQSFADYSIVIGYLDPKKTCELGDRVEFDAVFNTCLNIYVVRSYREPRALFNIGYRICNSNSRRLLEVAAKADSSLPFGYLWTREKYFGVVRDTTGLLTPYLLSSSRLKALSVLVEDVGPGRFCRFAVKEVAERSLQKFEEAIGKEKGVFNVCGFLIENNRIHLPEYTTVTVIYEDGVFFSNKPLGSWFRIDAVCRLQNTTREMVFEAVRMEELNVLEMLPVTIRMQDQKVLYKALCAYDKELGAFRSKLYGFITDPNGVALKRYGNSLQSFWVSFEGNHYRTPFIIRSYFTEECISSLENVSTVCNSEGEKRSSPCSSPAVQSQIVFKPFISLKSEPTPAMITSNVVACNSESCTGSRLIRKILGNKKLVRRYSLCGGADTIVRLAICTSYGN